MECITVAVPPGPFQSAILTSTALIALLAGGTDSLRLVRTFNPQTLSDTSSPSAKQWWLAVGDIQDPLNGRFVSVGNPGMEFYDERHRDKVPLALAGKLWQLHGATIIRSVIPVDCTDEDVAILQKKVYSSFLCSIDAGAQNISRCPCTEFPITSVLGFFQRMKLLYHPAYKGDTDKEALDVAFLEIAKKTSETLKDVILHLHTEWLPATNVVRKAVDQRQDRVIVLSHYAPWHDHLYDYEEELQLKEEETIKFVVFQDERSGQWRVTAPAIKGDRFANRALIAEPLRGLSGDALVTACGIVGANFVHHSGFTGGADTKEAIFKMINFPN